MTLEERVALLEQRAGFPITLNLTDREARALDIALYEYVHTTEDANRVDARRVLAQLRQYAIRYERHVPVAESTDDAD